MHKHQQLSKQNVWGFGSIDADDDVVDVVVAVDVADEHDDEKQGRVARTLI